MNVIGIVLAAGAGRRMGAPKALLRDVTGKPWLHRAVNVLGAAGAEPVLVTLGAAADKARDLVPESASEVFVPDWNSGMAASLRAALETAEIYATEETSAALVTLVDLPELHPNAALRLLGPSPHSSLLRQAVYEGRRGHPVLLGRAHWGPVRHSISGDTGARKYLESHKAQLVDCTDIGGGSDIDYQTSGYPLDSGWPRKS